MRHEAPPARRPALTADRWPVGAATGIGSLPGTDVREAMRLVLGELPALPHLPELPERGPGADLLGRGATMLSDLHVDLQPSGWRLVPRGGLDERRARDFLERDVDTLEELAADHDGAVKLQSAGPWTLAAGLELISGGGKALSDRGATRDLAASLADGLAAQVADVARRLPRATVVVQLDEPSLPAVLEGRVPTASGFQTLRRLEGVVVRDALAAVLKAVSDAGALTVVHCCAEDAPLALIRAAGADALSVDLSLLRTDQYDEVGEAVDAGLGLVLGAVPSTDPGRDVALREVLTPIRTLWRHVGTSPEALAATAVVTPTCGLAGASPDWARRAMTLAREAGRALTEAPEEGSR